MIRIFLVDDHPIVRDGIRSLLEREAAVQVVGTAGNGQELLDQLPDTPTDLVLIDVNMPVMDGYETTLRLREEYPEVRILALSMLIEELYIGRMLDAGASGYLLKSTGKDEIIHAIRMVMDGKLFLCSEIGLGMLRKVLDWNANVTPASAVRSQLLSKREMEVLQLIAEGLTNAEIADQLFTSKRTVETHRQNILEKTQAKNTAALVKIALADGLIK
ncbi:response regulator [Hymenobacter arizonensis]|uniref:DNA-binding response regulator, NarL/FixJ family, contains REC and HTH domains n=1 Tax=Hymenobacter arizonensis TaxID=1227077 RepID=A0A1I5VEP2_HYMAR|nr:response regulator transcription factor [Hymenobacter arizonensis]SFQ05456.1 DNA-binding response regulator, NarL/FixJ family, contains REC and HTH domains [Hymenobacter arizonensis]